MAIEIAIVAVFDFDFDPDFSGARNIAWRGMMR